MKVRDIRPVPALSDTALRGFLEDLREAVQVGLPEATSVGDILDKYVRRRELVNSGFPYSRGQFGGGGGGTNTTIIVPGPPSGGPDAPDLTPPPTPTGLTVTAGLSFLIIECDAALYTQGHGHDRTIVYGAKWPSGPAPTFSSAVPLTEFQGTIASYPTDLGTRWCIWIKWQSVDGVLSVSPAGGTNGAQATTGLVGTSDLGAAIVLAGNLAPGAVTADKAALEIGGENLLANNSFEVDADSNGLADGWAVQGSTQTPVATRVAGRISGWAQRIAWTGTNTTTKGFSTDLLLGGGVRGGWRAAGTYVVSFYAKSNAAKASGCQLVWTNPPISTTVLKNPNLATTWQRYAFRITISGTVEANGKLALSCVSGAAITGSIDFDDVQVEDGDMLSGYFGKLALNTIVAGDGALANLAVLNANIGALAVDDGKVANLSAAKLTVGDGTIGGDLKSSNYVASVSGWRVRPNGVSEFSDIIARGTIFATAGAIGGNTVTSTEVRSPNYVAGSVGWRLPTTGLVEAYASAGARRFNLGATGTTPVLQIGSALSILGNGTASFAGDLNAAGGTFSGSLTAVNGTFSGTLTAAAVNAVNTVNVAPNAITLPISAYTAGATTANTVQTAVITITDAPIIVLGGITAENNSNAGFVAVLTLRRGATVIASASAYLWPNGSGGVPTTLALPPIKDEPGPGTYVYTLTTSGSVGNIESTNRGLLLLGVKR